ncbi:MAG: peptidoglycan bridge formation glycyltransferase FemA/FemB family protein [Patescibacteria group bacterium]|nr:peptidoglycan bridge formation glycyltransferase FemA/FemB family protein [Patescibacteria group bacterium]
MNFIKTENNHKKKFEGFVNSQKETTCMQMWEWSDFRNKLFPGLYKRTGVVDTENNFHLTATLFINQFRFIGKIIYIPQGPIWDSQEALAIFSEKIQVCSKSKCIAVICEPRIKKESIEEQELLNLGYKFTNKAVQPRTTVFLDLRGTEEELMSRFSKSTRYNIKYAQRKGISIRKYSKPDDVGRIKMFFDLLKQTQERKYFQVQTLKYFEDLWTEFSRNNHIFLVEAHYKDKHLGTIIVLHNGIWSASLFSASSLEHSELKPIYLARWESILEAKGRGCRFYDFFGATDSEDSKHPFYKTTQHKLGFGRELTKFAGTYELIIDSLRYKIWQKLVNLGIFKFYEENFLKEFRKRSK